MSRFVTPSESKQLTLELDGSLVAKFRNVRDCVAQGVYQKGLGNVSAALDLSPGNLTRMLADRDASDHGRKLGVDDLERYMQEYRDFTPILYLCEKYLGDKAAAQAATTERLEQMLQQLPALIAAAGIAKKR